MVKYVVTAKLNLSKESGFEGRFINKDGEVCYLSICLCISVSFWQFYIYLSYLSVCFYLSILVLHVFLFIVRFQAMLTMVPKEFSFESTKIDLGVVIGGSIGGLVFLIIVGIVLWKVRFRAYDDSY